MTEKTAKENEINSLITKVYNSTEKLIISKSNIKKIEAYYKTATSNNADINLETFISSSGNLKEVIQLLLSGKDEIRKQLASHKALQPGILAECVFLQTLAKVLGFKHYIDLETAPFAEVPKEFSKYIKDSSDTACSARYLYYNKKDYTSCIIQYGNPKAGDAAAILHSNNITIEIKDMPALLLDTDLTYNEEGKIIISETIQNNSPSYIPIIENFNKTNSIFAWEGSNYKLFTDASNNTTRNALLKGFIGNSTIDVILTITKDEDLIVLKTSDLTAVFPNNEYLIDTSTSEIRTTGKNYLTTAFTPKHLKEVLKNFNIDLDDTKKCSVSTHNEHIKEIGGRGKDKTIKTRLKIGNIFFVQMKNVSIENDKYQFEFDKIYQSKAGIALHVDIKKTKEEIKQNLYNSIINKQ